MTPPIKRVGLAVDLLFDWGFVPISIAFAVGLIHGYLTGEFDPFGWIIVGVAIAVMAAIGVTFVGELDVSTTK